LIYFFHKAFSLITTRIILLLILALYITISILFHLNVGNIINILSEHSIYSFLGFLILYSLISLFCIPIFLVAIAVGAVFEPMLGLALNLTGAIIAASCGFYLSRILKPKKFLTIKNARIKKLINQTENVGWKSVAVLRLSPIPFHIVNYYLGLTKIKFNQFMLSSMIFLIPKTIILTCCGYYGLAIIDTIHIKQLLNNFINLYFT
jgi:uncharacterized membrane protein YdjX (TVP38/TMEM64 family)